MAVSKVWLKVNRVAAETCEAAGRVGVADIHEAMDPRESRAALMSPRMRPLLRSLRVAGPAVTALCSSGDNLMMHRALFLSQPGDVLVVVCPAEDSGAQWGDVAAQYAASKGLAGVVVQGCIRDVGTLERMSFPVWLTAIWPIHPEKKGAGMVNAPVVCAGAVVHPGDLIVADGDGVVVVPRQAAASVIERATARAHKEDKFAEDIRAGAAPWDFSGAKESYSAMQVEEFDSAFEE